MKAPSPLSLRILTHNIRYATPSPFPGEEPWPTRRPRLLNELLYTSRHCPETFICLQEVLHGQLTDILTGLNEQSRGSSASAVSRGGKEGQQQARAEAAAAAAAEWQYIGVGRDDGHEAGEYSPIFYRPTVWEVEHWKTVWLSETPEKPSRGWDAASTRILTIGTFVHRETKKRVVACSTHLDDQGSLSRYNAAYMILREFEKATTTTEGHGETIGGFLAGDLNSQPHEEAYQVLNGEGSALRDLKTLVPKERWYGHEKTFTGFVPEEEGKEGTRIDFVFLGPMTDVEEREKRVRKDVVAWEVEGYAVLEGRFDDGVYISDHRGVVGDVQLV